MYLAIDDAATATQQRYTRLARQIWTRLRLDDHVATMREEAGDHEAQVAVRLHIPVTLAVTATGAAGLADTLFRLFGGSEALDLLDAEQDPAWPSVLPDQIAAALIDDLHVVDTDDDTDDCPYDPHRVWYAY